MNTIFLTAGVAFAVYCYVLKTGTLETACASAFAVIVFAELLRSFGARSEIKPVWRISLFTNVNLVIVVAISVGLQVWNQHNATLGHFLKTAYLPLTDCLWLLAIGALPLVILEIVLEIVKVVRHARWQKTDCAMNDQLESTVHAWSDSVSGGAAQTTRPAGNRVAVLQDRD